MQVRNGNIVLMRDGRQVVVTDAADPGFPEGEYQTISKVDYYEGREVVTSSMPAETIFVGRLQDTGATVVSDMSEVVSILN